jgi:tRNA 2-thiouridine synthesizing protein E
MAQKEIAGASVEVNEEGYMTDPGQWSREIAAEFAKELGLPALSEAHWKVVDFLRADFSEKGSVPTIRRIQKAGGVPTKELYALFPGGPVKKAAKIAGLTKPASGV